MNDVNDMKTDDFLVLANRKKLATLSPIVQTATFTTIPSNQPPSPRSVFEESENDFSDISSISSISFRSSRRKRKRRAQPHQQHRDPARFESEPRKPEPPQPTKPPNPNPEVESEPSTRPEPEEQRQPEPEPLTPPEPEEQRQPEPETETEDKDPEPEQPTKEEKKEEEEEEQNVEEKENEQKQQQFVLGPDQNLVGLLRSRVAVSSKTEHEVSFPDTPDLTLTKRPTASLLTSFPSFTEVPVPRNRTPPSFNFPTYETPSSPSRQSLYSLPVQSTVPRTVPSNYPHSHSHFPSSSTYQPYQHRQPPYQPYQPQPQPIPSSPVASRYSHYSHYRIPSPAPSSTVHRSPSPSLARTIHRSPSPTRSIHRSPSPALSVRRSPSIASSNRRPSSPASSIHRSSSPPSPVVRSPSHSSSHVKEDMARLLEEQRSLHEEEMKTMRNDLQSMKEILSAINQQRIDEQKEKRTIHWEERLEKRLDMDIDERLREMLENGGRWTTDFEIQNADRLMKQLELVKMKRRMDIDEFVESCEDWVRTIVNITSLICLRLGLTEAKEWAHSIEQSINTKKFTYLFRRMYKTHKPQLAKYTDPSTKIVLMIVAPLLYQIVLKVGSYVARQVAESASERISSESAPSAPSIPATPSAPPVPSVPSIPSTPSIPSSSSGGDFEVTAPLRRVSTGVGRQMDLSAATSTVTNMIESQARQEERKRMRKEIQQQIL